MGVFFLVICILSEISSILSAVETVCRWGLVEGRDMIKELINPEYKNLPETSTMSLVCRMTDPFWVTGKIVIPDSVFYVVKGLMIMFERVIYGSELVKNHIYWTT